jgi:glycosyltransferase involved in cell wall biosynthesis
MNSISIIIPLYNRIHLIGETLDSLLPEKHNNISLDIIVIDDGSSDGGIEYVAREYKWVRVFKQENKGAPAARNLGLSKATGDYILFLDSDDIIDPDFFREKASVLNSNPDLAAVYGPWEHFSGNSNNERIILPRHSQYPINTQPAYTDHLQSLLSGWYIICHALLWRRDVLIKLGGYNEKLMVNQDVDLLFRALVTRNKIQGVESPLAWYRTHEDINRVGNVNVKKLEAIYSLRIRFIEILQKENLYIPPFTSELGQYCFNIWASHRSTYPDIALKFYLLSRDLFPTLEIKGGILYRFLGKILGARNVVILKSWIKK